MSLDGDKKRTLLNGGNLVQDMACSLVNSLLAFYLITCQSRGLN